MRKRTTSPAPEAASTIDDVRELIEAGERISRWARAWRDLEVPDTAPTPGRRAALIRGMHAAKFILTAVRTLGNPQALPDDVQLATAVVDEAACLVGPRDVESLARLSLVSCIERAAGNAGGHIHPVEWERAQFLETWPHLPPVDAALFAAAVRAWEAATRDPARSPAVWRVVIEASRSAGLSKVTVPALRKAWQRSSVPLPKRLGRRKRHTR